MGKLPSVKGGRLLREIPSKKMTDPKDSFPGVGTLERKTQKRQVLLSAGDPSLTHPAVSSRISSGSWNDSAPGAPASQFPTDVYRFPLPGYSAARPCRPRSPNLTLAARPFHFPRTYETC